MLEPGNLPADLRVLIARQERVESITELRATGNRRRPARLAMSAIPLPWRGAGPQWKQFMELSRAQGHVW